MNSKTILVAILIANLLLLHGGALFGNEAYTYHDGKRERTIYLQTDLVAQFGRQSAPMATQAEANFQSRQVRIWKLKGDSKLKSLIQEKASLSKEGFDSPVFTNGKNGGSKRALPGNVIVSLEVHWGQEQVQAWAENQNLKLLKKLPLKGNLFLVATQPGWPSLDVANKLRNQNGVLWATPNWWVERTAR